MLIPFSIYQQETLLLDPMFEVPGSDVKTVHITDDCVKGSCAPQYMRRTATSSTGTASNDPAPTTTSNTPEEEESSTKVRLTQ